MGDYNIKDTQSFIKIKKLYTSMSDFKTNDFVKIEYDIFSNGNLLQSTDSKKLKKLEDNKNLNSHISIILGKGQIFMSLDEDIEKFAKLNTLRTVEFSAEKAYGKKQKNLIKTYPKSVFDEQKLKAIVGMTYDFNGNYGTVKSVVGGRVLVDFNNLFAGKDIKIEYKIIEKIIKIDEKIKIVLESFYKMPQNLYKIEFDEKKLKLIVPSALIQLKDIILKSLEDIIPELKDLKVEFEELSIPKKEK